MNSPNIPRPQVMRSACPQSARHRNERTRLLRAARVPFAVITGLVEGRAALISGAGSGIGRATAKLLAEHGARVAVVDLVGAHAEQTAVEIRQAGGQAIALQGDAADEAEVARV